jgi:tetratricopeptide (TPR) repeat protein
LQKNHFSDRTAFILLTLLGVLAYANSLTVPFHYDDIHFLRENSLIKSLPLFFHSLGDNYSQLITGRMFLLFTFYLNYLFSGLDTFSYHLVNLFLHIATAFLFYLLCSWYVGRPDDKQLKIKCVFAAALFLLHPIATESVTYLSSRSSVLSTFCILAALFAFFKGTVGKFRVVPYAFSLLFFCFGLSAKESAIVTPALMLLFDLSFITDRKPFSSRVKYYVPFLGILLAASFFYAKYLVHPEVSDRAWTTHVLTEFKVFVQYLRLLILPIGLSIYHDVRESISIDFPVILSVAITAGLLILAMLIRRKNRIMFFSILWFFINLAPLLVVKLTDFMAERWVYAASLGFAFAVSELLALVFQWQKRTAIVLSISLLVCLGTLTALRNRVYSDPVTLWTDAAGKSPGETKPFVNLCASYVERGDADNAIRMCGEAIKKGDRSDEVYINLASALFVKNDLNSAEDILTALANNAYREVYHYNLGLIYTTKKEYHKAIQEYEAILVAHPQSVTALAALGKSYRMLNQERKSRDYYSLAVKGLPQNGEDFLMLAESHFQLGEQVAGIASLNEALVTEPLNVNIRNVIASSNLAQKNYDEAYKHYAVMAKISPGMSAAYEGMGRALLAKGERAKAKRNFLKALSLLPPTAPARNELVVLLGKT